MTKEQALENLFNAAKFASMPYESHIIVVRSYEILKDIITPAEAKENK